jgi:hypothetical protein
MLSMKLLCNISQGRGISLPKDVVSLLNLCLSILIIIRQILFFPDVYDMESHFWHFLKVIHYITVKHNKMIFHIFLYYNNFFCSQLVMTDTQILLLFVQCGKGAL